MTSLPYRTADSTPRAAVMAAPMRMSHDAGHTMPEPDQRITSEVRPWCVRPWYVLGNAGTTIRVDADLTGDTVVDNYRPRTELGRKLLALRRAYVTTGGQLLDGTALDTEVQLRRGGVADA